MANQAKVAEIYAQLVLDTAKFKAAMNDATVQTKQFSANMRTQMNDARGSVRLVSEELGIHMPRALQNYVAKLPGVATAMSAAFNTVAVLALLNIVVQAGEEISEFANKTEDAARKNKEAWEGITTPLKLSNDEMQVVNDNLANAVAKLEHKPQNGIKLAIDEAVESADKLSSKLTEDLNKIQLTLKSSAPGVVSQLFGEASTKGLQLSYSDLQARIAAANQAGTKAVDAARNTPGTDKDREAAVESAKKAWQDALTPLFEEGAKTFGDALSKALAADRSQRDNAKRLGLDPAKLDTGMTSQIQTASSLSDFYNGQKLAQQLGATNDILTAKEKVLTAQKEDNDDAKKASAELLQTYETAFQKQKAMYGMSLIAESNFWRSRLRDFASNSKEFAEVYAKANDPITKLFAGTESAYRDRTGTPPVMMEARNSDADTVAIARGAEQQASLNAAFAEATTKYNLNIGAINEHDAALQNASAHTDEYKAKLATLVAELEKLHAEEFDVDGKNIDPENAGKQQQVTNQINALNAQRQIQTLTDTQATLSTTWTGMIDSVFDELIKKSQDTTGQIKQIASSMIEGINSELAKGFTGQKTNWSRMFQSTGESLTKTGLGKLEGLGLSALGFGGGKRDGSSAASALFVQVAGGAGVGTIGSGINALFPSAKPAVAGPNGQLAGSITSMATRGLLGWLNDSNWASSLFGGSLFGSGGKFGGGYALGGDVAAGVPINVGEMGMERFTPTVPGHITPNKELRSGHGDTYIDARATDPVMVHDAVARANRQTYSRAVHDAGQIMAERMRRTPR